MCLYDAPELLQFPDLVQRAKDDWNFRISDQVKNPDGTDI